MVENFYQWGLGYGCYWLSSDAVPIGEASGMLL